MNDADREMAIDRGMIGQALTMIATEACVADVASQTEGIVALRARFARLRKLVSQLECIMRDHALRAPRPQKVASHE